MTFNHGYRRRHVALTFLFILINYADKAVVGLASVPIMRDLGLTHREFGALGSAFFSLFSLAGVAIGFVANRVGTKPLMAVMGSVWALTLLPVSVSSSFLVLLVSRIVLGAAEGPAFPVALHSVYKWFDDTERALPTSIVASGAAFGTGVLAPLITWIIAAVGWHAAFAALGLSGLLWVAAWSALAVEGPEPSAAANSTSRDGSAMPRCAPSADSRLPYRRILGSGTALGVFLAGFAAYWIIGLNLVWLANYLIKIVGLSARDAAWCLLLPASSQMLLAPGIGLLSQRLSARGWSSRAARGYLGCGCVLAGGVCVLAMSQSPAVWSTIALLTVGFSAGSVIFTLGGTLIGEISPPAQRGAMLGITNSIHTLAGLCAPYAMGRMIDAAATPAAGFRSGFLSAAVLVIALGSIAAVLIDPERDRRRFARYLAHPAA